MKTRSDRVLHGFFQAINQKVFRRGRRVIQEGLWVAIGQIASALGALVGVRLLTEHISPEVFGAVSLALGIILLGFNLTCAPLFQAVLRLFPEMAAKGQVSILRVTVRRLLWRTTFTFVTLLAIIGTVHSILAGQIIWMYLSLAAVYFIDSLRGLSTNFLSAARRHRPFAIWNAYEAYSRPLGAIVAVMTWGATAESVLIGYALSSALGFMLFGLKVKAEGADLDKCATVDEGVKRQVVQYAIPLIPLALVVWTSSLSDRYILGGVLNLEQVGIYAAAYGLISRPFLILGHILTLTLRPIYFQACSQQDVALGKKVISSWLKLTAILAALGVAGCAVCGNVLSSILLAEKYRGAASMLPWIGLGCAFYVIANVYEQVIYARKQTGILLKMHVAVATFSLIAAYAGVRCFGLFGAALACPIYFLFHLACAAYLARSSNPRRASSAIHWNWKLQDSNKRA